LIAPGPILVELRFVLAQLGRESGLRRELGLRDVPSQEAVARLVPPAEIVQVGGERLGVGAQLPAGRHQAFPGLDHDRSAVAGRFAGPLDDLELGFTVVQDVEPIQAFFQDIKGRVGAVDLERFFLVQGAHPQIDAAAEDVDFSGVIILTGQLGEFDLGLALSPEITSSAELDFDPAVLCSELVAFGYGQVDGAGFVAEVPGALNRSTTRDGVDAYIAAVVIALVLGRCQDRKTKDTCDQCRK
jgi:hypothetical protein